jgi:hypothetical protein
MAMAEAKAKPVKKEEARVRNIAAVSLALVSTLQLLQIQSSCNLSHNWGSSSITLGNSVFCTIGNDSRTWRKSRSWVFLMLHHHDCHKNANTNHQMQARIIRFQTPKKEIIRYPFWEDLFPDF